MMWYRILIASNIAFLLGIFTFFLGEYVLPGAAMVTLPAGGILAGAAGIVAGISGIALIWEPDGRA